jgi:hypothetical protein
MIWYNIYNIMLISNHTISLWNYRLPLLRSESRLVKEHVRNTLGTQNLPTATPAQWEPPCPRMFRGIDRHCLTLPCGEPFFFIIDCHCLIVPCGEPEYYYYYYCCFNENNNNIIVVDLMKILLLLHTHTIHIDILLLLYS